MFLKSVKNTKFVVTTKVLSMLKMHQNPFSAGAPRGTLLGEPTALPQTQVCSWLE